jgi:hypothetical protein
MKDDAKAYGANLGPLEKNNRGARCCAHCGCSQTVAVAKNTAHRLTGWAATYQHKEAYEGLEITIYDEDDED